MSEEKPLIPPDATPRKGGSGRRPRATASIVA
ncbi:hypothetical protein ACVWZD_006307 [Streptomyces sp. TE3672]